MCVRWVIISELNSATEHEKKEANRSSSSSNLCMKFEFHDEQCAHTRWWKKSEREREKKMEETGRHVSGHECIFMSLNFNYWHGGHLKFQFFFLICCCCCCSWTSSSWPGHERLNKICLMLLNYIYQTRLEKRETPIGWQSNESSWHMSWRGGERLRWTHNCWLFKVNLSHALPGQTVQCAPKKLKMQ